MDPPVDSIKTTISGVARPPSEALFALDTGLLHFLLDDEQRAACPAAATRVTAIVAEQGLTIAELTYYEFRRSLEYLARQDRKKLYVAQGLALLATAELLPLTERSRWDGAATFWAIIRQRGVTLPENDFLILCSAALHGRKLLTADARFAAALRLAGPEYVAQVEVVALQTPPLPDPPLP